MKKFVCLIFVLIFSLCILLAGCRATPADNGVFTSAYTDTASMDSVELEENATIRAIQVQNYTNNNPKAKKVYGGCYIDDDKVLHVLFTKKVKHATIDDINELTNNSVTIEVCEYTLDELYELKEQISDKIADCDKQLDVSTVAVSEQQNRVVVRIKDCTDEKIELFKKEISDSDALAFGSGYIKKVDK